MTEDVTRTVEELKAQVEQVGAANQRALAQKEAAEAERDRLLERLAAEFKVSTVEDAQALLVRLDAQLDSEIAKVRAALEESSDAQP